MVKLNLLQCLPQVILTSIALSSNNALAQIVPDATLPNKSVIDNSQPNIDRIIGGTTSANNLFHSFQQFSIKNGTTAHFDNAINISNIFTRVTGNSISNIDGIIQTNGTANLFLLNPNGIIFRENARLNVGGSFIGSTAHSIQFSDGKEFNAFNPQIETKALLSINLPTALQFSTNPSSIIVQGKGHLKDIDSNTFAVLDLIGDTLNVPKGKTLALIGGELRLQGGNLQAEAGRVELGSIKSQGNVNLIFTDTGWAFSYQNIERFADITFEQVASVNTTGETGGDVQIQGGNIAFQDGSVILTNTRGSGNAGDVTVTASGLLEFTGLSNEPLPLPSAVLSETISSGRGGDITVTSQKLVLQDGTQLASNTFSTGDAGNITVNSEVIELAGLSPIIPDIRSGFVSQTIGGGNAGNITVNTNRLIVRETAQINVFSGSLGNGGNIVINALESVNLASNSDLPLAGGLFSNAQGSGNAGNITVNTKNLTLSEEGQIVSATFFAGNGGNITINASDSVNLSGASENLTTGIFATASSPPAIFNVIGTGKGGNITITTSQLNIQDNAQINVSNFDRRDIFAPGVGNPGNISIMADSLNIDRGQIITVANLADGGNINLDIDDVSILSNQALISATAGIAEEFGNGGDVNFDSQFIIASGNSNITAQAFKGTGGNINLKGEGLFFTPDTIVNASSELGADGEVEIRTPETNPIQGLIERQNLDYPQQIVLGCHADTSISEGSLTYKGKGGVPELSTDKFSGDTLLDDLRPVPSHGQSNTTATIPPAQVASNKIKEAQGWQWKNENKRTVVLIGDRVKGNQPSNMQTIFKNCQNN